jgi:uncharacterized membrane protein
VIVISRRCVGVCVMDVDLVAAYVALGVTIFVAGTWIAVIWQLISARGMAEPETTHLWGDHESRLS